MLVEGGASPKTCQDLARHSTSRLTLDRYAHTKSRDKEDALTGGLGHISMPRPPREDSTVSTTGSGERLEQAPALYVTIPCVAVQQVPD